MKNPLLGVFLLFAVSCNSGERVIGQKDHVSEGGADSIEIGTAQRPKIYAIGVAECDAYLKKYQDCLSTSIPDPQKPAFEESLHQTWILWNQIYFDDVKRPLLAQACTETSAITHAVFQTYGCN